MMTIMNLCANCEQTIIFARYREVGRPEPDYDPSDDPVVWRHASTGYAMCPGHGFAVPFAPTAKPAETVILEMVPKTAEYVYVASSWRNDFHPAVCAALKAAEVAHYDFRNPPGGSGFSWAEVTPDAERGIAAKGSDWVSYNLYRQMIAHPRAVEGFRADFAAMERADTFLMVLPCGKSAHLELGWAIGAGKRTIILAEDPMEPELMYLMADHITDSLVEVLGLLGVED